MLLLSVVSTLRVQRSGEEQEHRLPSAVEGFRAFYRPDSIQRAGLVGVGGKASKPTDEVHSLQGQRLKIKLCKGIRWRSYGGYGYYSGAVDTFV